MRKHNKIIAIIIVFALSFVMIFSTSYIVANSNHTCTGDYCPTCATIRFYSDLLNDFSNVLLALSCLLLVCFAGVTIYKYSLIVNRYDNPIDLKVRLNN